MRQIIKKTSPDYFEKWKTRYKIVNRHEPTYDDFNCPEKQRLKEDMLSEQYGLCCYCMKSIEYRDGHIEHIKPRHPFVKETMDYSNMLISCNGTKAYKEDKESCGHQRGNWYDANYISPLEANVESHFTYDLNGHIIPKANDKRALETISHLKLDCYSLCKKRQTAIYVALECGDLSYDDIITEYSTPTHNLLPEYCMAVIYCAKHMKKLKN